MHVNSFAWSGDERGIPIPEDHGSARLDALSAWDNSRDTPQKVLHNTVSDNGTLLLSLVLLSLRHVSTNYAIRSTYRDVTYSLMWKKDHFVIGTY